MEFSHAVPTKADLRLQSANQAWVLPFQQVLAAARSTGGGTAPGH